MRPATSRNPGWLRALLYALGLHAAVIAMLIVGFRIVSHNEPVHGPVMQAVVVREPSAEAAAEERKQHEAEAKQLAEEQRRKDAERASLEAERKKEEEATRKKQAAEAEKKQREAERRKEQQQRQQQAEQTLREQLAEEEKSRVAARSARLMSEVEKYKAAIAQRVSRQWVRPPTSRKGLQCTVHVRQAPGGEVLEAKVVRSSGDVIFDRSVESAVYKASPLPAPANPEVFDRDIEFIFKPEE